MKQSVQGEVSQVSKVAGPTRSRPAQYHTGAHASYLTQLSAMINSSPRVQALAQMKEDIQEGARVQSLQQLAEQIQPGAPAQLRQENSNGGNSLENQSSLNTAEGFAAQLKIGIAGTLAHSDRLAGIDDAIEDHDPSATESQSSCGCGSTEGTGAGAMLADSKQEKLPAQKKNDGENYPAPAELAAAPATNLSNAGSFAPVQRKIELHDRDEGTYRETEKDKAASDAGDLFFTGGYHKTLPVFLNANVVNFVIKFVEEAMGIDEKTEDETYYKELDKGIKTLSGGVAEALGSAVFYTDDAVVTKEISFPAHWLTQALQKPLLRDPLAKRGGFMNRFQSAFGTLFTPRSKEETEEDLGELPEKVQYQKVANATTAFTFFGQGNKPLISGPYMYVRNALAAAPSRDEGSVFTAKNAASIQDPEDEQLKGDALTASLPPAAADSNELVTHKAYARKKSRGLGQIAAMNGWNALGYAGYFTHHGKGPLNVGVDWEWLHIRGAQNGGDTAPENLVAGTSIANSAMIPIEDKINEWTSKASSERSLMIRYIGKRISGTNLGNAITLKIWAPEGLPDTLDKTDESKSLEATFNPIKETSFDKMHRQMVAAQQEHAGHGSSVKKNT
jgi:hypothetical protein